VREIHDWHPGQVRKTGRDITLRPSRVADSLLDASSLVLSDSPIGDDAVHISYYPPNSCLVPATRTTRRTQVTRRQTSTAGAGSASHPEQGAEVSVHLATVPPAERPVGAGNCAISCDVVLFMDQAAEPVPPQHLNTCVTPCSGYGHVAEGIGPEQAVRRTVHPTQRNGR
jgi:hypothetical protein